ncbi:MAG: hypothetical protein Rsou_2014 [Candidatus Ruthia sp. Asou_11_S2]|nr:hypothetical protein [Candidatus Ruthia sp. Asou_11_S2]
MNVFELAYQALMSTEIDEKINLVNQLNGFKNNQVLDYQSSFHQQSIPTPGKPEKPILVRFQSVPKRDKSDMGFIKTIHAICHIEFNAINLALDAVYRFKDMPDKFYQDWIQVAFEESQHFSLINHYLIKIGYQYGDFQAHNGLWKMTKDTDYDVLARMALAPKVLEVRGLDVIPNIQKKFKHSNFKAMVKILDTIFSDEINHVKIGNYWFHTLCQQRFLDPIQTFDQLVKKHIGNQLRGPFNIEARKLANFSQQELDYLQS